MDLFGVVFKKLCQMQDHLDFLYIIFQKLIVLLYLCFISLAAYKSVVHFELIFVKDVKSMYHCFACGYLVSPLSFDRKTTPFSIELALLLLTAAAAA